MPSMTSSGVSTDFAASNPRMGRPCDLPIPSRRQREPVASTTRLAPKSNTSSAVTALVRKISTFCILFNWFTR